MWLSFCIHFLLHAYEGDNLFFVHRQRRFLTLGCDSFLGSRNNCMWQPQIISWNVYIIHNCDNYEIKEKFARSNGYWNRTRFFNSPRADYTFSYSECNWGKKSISRRTLLMGAQQEKMIAINTHNTCGNVYNDSIHSGKREASILCTKRVKNNTKP